MIKKILMVIGSIVFCVLVMLAPILLGYNIGTGSWNKSLPTFLLYIMVFVEFVVLWAVVYDEGTKNE